ncbi:McrC family protein [Halalkalicoccus salilacus]|uniref:McrC family protein n=1 Tax=Halalkalicoccus salilacus TaxID=3117459 RepID=UPI00300F4CEF
MSVQHHKGLSASEADYQLREYEATPYLEQDELPPLAQQAVRREINTTDQSKEKERLILEYRADGNARIRATQYVGVVALPEGPTIEIRPKIPNTDLLGLLQYAHGIDAQTFEYKTQLASGTRFIDALATLFENELDRVLTQGLHRSYSRVSRTTEHVRGRIEVQKQLQKQGPTPTAFECTYDELTVDTTINRAILYATTILMRLTSDPELNRALRRHQQQLWRRVELTPVRPIELESIELTRLMGYYEDLVRLTKLVLRSIHLEELRAANRDTYALLMDMDRIFETVVQRLVSELANQRGWNTTPEATSTRLVSGGQRRIQIRPDVLVTDGDRPVLVGDAKWKQDDPEANSREPSSGDIYQLVSYQVAHDTPGVLFYPEQEQTLRSTYQVRGLDSLTVVEVPVKAGDGQRLIETIEDSVATQLPW